MDYIMFDPSKVCHQSYLEMFYHQFKYSIAEVIAEFGSLGVIINPAQVV